MGIFFRNSKIQYEISEIQYENMGIYPIFSKNPRISYHINMSRKVIILIQCFTHIMSKTFYIYDYHDNWIATW